MVDDEEGDTLTYNYKNTFKYVKEKNGNGLTGDEIVTMPNPRMFISHFYYRFHFIYSQEYNKIKYSTRY